MSREDEIRALLEILPALFGNNTKRFPLCRKRPNEIARFLRARPSREKLDYALVVILAAIRRAERS